MLWTDLVPVSLNLVDLAGLAGLPISILAIYKSNKIGKKQIEVMEKANYLNFNSPELVVIVQATNQIHDQVLIENVKYSIASDIKVFKYEHKRTYPHLKNHLLFQKVGDEKFVQINNFTMINSGDNKLLSLNPEELLIDSPLSIIEFVKNVKVEYGIKIPDQSLSELINWFYPCNNYPCKETSPGRIPANCDLIFILYKGSDGKAYGLVLPYRFSVSQNRMMNLKSIDIRAL